MTGPDQHHQPKVAVGEGALDSDSAAGNQTGLTPPALPAYNASLTRIVIPGTAIWFIAFAVLLFFIPDLRANDAMIWLWTCLTGWVLGLVGLLIYRWQQRAVRRGSRGAQTSSLD